MLALAIPPSFLLSKSPLSLQEVRWALEAGIIGAQTTVDIATDLVAAGSTEAVAIELAGLTREELGEAAHLLRQVRIPEELLDFIRRKWTWLVLAWTYEKHSGDSDFVAQVDSLYADLGYPDEMIPFGPFSQSYQGKVDPDDARKQITAAWQKYLAHGNSLYGRRDGRS
jgi:hypothetical protein